MKQKMREGARRSRERRTSQSLERERPTPALLEAPHGLRSAAAAQKAPAKPGAAHPREAVHLKPSEPEPDQELEFSEDEEALEEAAEEQEAEEAEEEEGQEELGEEELGDEEEQESEAREEAGEEEESARELQEDSQPTRQALLVERQQSARNPTDPQDQSSRHTFTSGPQPDPKAGPKRRLSDPETNFCEQQAPARRGGESKAISRGENKVGIDFNVQKLEEAGNRSPIRDRFSHDGAEGWRTGKPDDTLEPDFSEMPVDIRVPEVGNMTQSSVMKVNNIMPDEEDGIMAKDIFAAFESLQKQASESATVYGNRGSAEKQSIGLKSLMDYKHNIDNLSEKEDSTRLIAAAIPSSKKQLPRSDSSKKLDQNPNMHKKSAPALHPKPQAVPQVAKKKPADPKPRTDSAPRAASQRQSPAKPKAAKVAAKGDPKPKQTGLPDNPRHSSATKPRTISQSKKQPALGRTPSPSQPPARGKARPLQVQLEPPDQKTDICEKARPPISPEDHF